MSTSAAAATVGKADELEARGLHDDALALLVAEAEEDPDPVLLARLVGARHLAGSRMPSAPSPSFRPPTATPGNERGELVPISPHELSVEVLRRSLGRHGCLWIRGLVDADAVERLRAGIDRALAAFDASDPDDERDHDGWYRHFVPDPGRYRVGGRRQWVRASGALWTADSPRMLHELTRLIERTGIGALVEDYFGERPALSANKCTLRRVPLDTNVGWHQDGAFLGTGVRSLNLWLGLDPCGRTAPGMDIVPRRFDHLVEAGTGEAIFEWSVDPGVVRREAAEAGVMRPEFEAGDALLFDHLFLHSTCVDDRMTHERHAMETWFFAPSTYPEGQIPLRY